MSQQPHFTPKIKHQLTSLNVWIFGVSLSEHIKTRLNSPCDEFKYQHLPPLFSLHTSRRNYGRMKSWENCSKPRDICVCPLHNSCSVTLKIMAVCRCGKIKLWACMVFPLNNVRKEASTSICLANEAILLLRSFFPKTSSVLHTRGVWYLWIL